MTPPLMAGTRILAAGGFLYAVARLWGAGSPTGRQWQAALAVGGLMLLGGNGALAWAEQMVPSGQASPIVATVPLWMVGWQ